MRTHNNATAELTRAELDRREAIRIEDESLLLSSLYATDGLVMPPIMSLEDGRVALGSGLVVATHQGQRRLIVIPPQRVVYPTSAGEYGVFVKNDAWARMTPAVGADLQPTFLDAGAYAYASGQLDAAAGIVDVVGIMILPLEAAGDNWVLLALLHVPSDPVQALLNPVYHFATLRLAVEAPSTPTTPTTPTTPSTAPSNVLLLDGTASMTGNLNVGGHAIVGITKLQSINAQPIDANVTRVGGFTAAQLMGSATPVGNNAVEVFEVNYVKDLSATFQAPKNVTVNLPSDAVPSGMQAAVSFSGEGTLVRRDGGKLTLEPAMRIRQQRHLEWPALGMDAALGKVVGIAGSTPAYYVSVSFEQPATASTPAQHVRQLLRVLVGGTVTVFDHEVTPNADGSPTLRPHDIDVSGTSMLWGGKPQPVPISLMGNPSDPSLNVPSLYVGGTRMVMVDNTGITVQDVTAVVKGSVLVAVQENIPTLEASDA